MPILNKKPVVSFTYADGRVEKYRVASSELIDASDPRLLDTNTNWVITCDLTGAVGREAPKRQGYFLERIGVPKVEVQAPAVLRPLVFTQITDEARIAYAASQAQAEKEAKDWFDWSIFRLLAAFVLVAMPLSVTGFAAKSFLERDEDKKRYARLFRI